MAQQCYLPRKTIYLVAFIRVGGLVYPYTVALEVIGEKSTAELDQLNCSQVFYPTIL